MAMTQCATTWTPWQGERIPTAWTLVLEALMDLQWHDRAELCAAVSERTGLLPKTVECLLQGAVRAGVLQRRRSRRKFRPVELCMRLDAPAWALERP